MMRLLRPVAHRLLVAFVLCLCRGPLALKNHRADVSCAKLRECGGQRWLKPCCSLYPPSKANILIERGHLDAQSQPSRHHTLTALQTAVRAERQMDLRRVIHPWIGPSFRLLL